MKINNYQSFYVGSESHKQYGNGSDLGVSKDTIVKYEFNTTDKAGNKVMDKLSRKEAMELLNSISKQYGENVMVQFSGDALDALKEDMFKEKNAETNETYIRQMKERNELLQAAIQPAQKLHLIIPNIQTNDRLEKSLEGAGEKVADAAYSIIKTDFLTHNIGNMTEEERQEMIALGLEKAKYLAESMDNNKATEFMGAMETIAKYGMNGKTDKQGNVTYDIKQGPMVGAPDDYMSTSDLMQTIAPDEYRNYSDMWQEALEKDDRSQMAELARYAIDWEKKAYGNRKDEIREEKEKFSTWKKEMEDTKLRDVNENIDRTNIHNFINSIIQQNRIMDNSYLYNNLQNFAKLLEK